MYNLGSKFQIQADYLDTTANNVQILHGIQRGFKIFTTTTGIRKYQVKRRKKKKKNVCKGQRAMLQNSLYLLFLETPGENNGKLILALEIDHTVVTVCSALQLSI